MDYKMQTFILAIPFIFSALRFLIEIVSHSSDKPEDEPKQKKVETDTTPLGGDPQLNRERILNMYDLKVTPDREKDVAIKAIYLYPIRGIKGIKVDTAEVWPFGMKYDRQWCILSKTKDKPLADHNSAKISLLRMVLLDSKDEITFDACNPKKLRIIFQDEKTCPHIKKRSHVLHFDKDYTNSKFVEAKKNYRGYLEDDDLNEWLSQIFEEDVYMIRAEKSRLSTINLSRLPEALEEDRRHAFVTDAAIHVINQESIASLTLDLYKKYENDPEAIKDLSVDLSTFRPTFVIDEEFDEAYCEEEFQELRIANTMFRNVGPCQRCKTTSLNWKLNARDPKMEPYTIIQEQRKHPKYGAIFGVYIQPDIIGTEKDFKELLGKQCEIPKDRSIQPGRGIVRMGDTFKIRVRRRDYSMQDAEEDEIKTE